MIRFVNRRKHSFSYRLISFFLCLSFTLSLITPPSLFAQSVSIPLNLPPPGAMVSLSPSFTPPILRGIKIYPENPLEFDFILQSGDTNKQGEELRTEAEQSIKYFLAALTIPENDLWVNLSPYEKDRIASEKLGITDLGRDLLSQDYMLKQLTASLIYPENDLGKEFWGKVYAKAQELYGTTEIPVNTFNKVWIVADRAAIYETNGTAFTVDSHLKVMLEEDYLALNENFKGRTENREQKTARPGSRDWRAGETSNVSSQIIREVVIPAIEKEVNEGKTFAQLRQIYNAVILATWFKNTLKDSLLGQVYVDKSKILGIDLKDKTAKEQIYQQYLQAFKKGVYNYIKEDIDAVTNQPIPRKYFSGGAELAKTADGAMLSKVVAQNTFTGDSTSLPSAAQASIISFANQPQATNKVHVRLVEPAIIPVNRRNARQAEITSILPEAYKDAAMLVGPMSLDQRIRAVEENIAEQRNAGRWLLRNAKPGQIAASQPSVPRIWNRANVMAGKFNKKLRDKFRTATAIDTFGPSNNVMAESMARSQILFRAPVMTAKLLNAVDANRVQKLFNNLIESGYINSDGELQDKFVELQTPEMGLDASFKNEEPIIYGVLLDLLWKRIEGFYLGGWDAQMQRGRGDQALDEHSYLGELAAKITTLLVRHEITQNIAMSQMSEAQLKKFKPVDFYVPMFVDFDEGHLKPDSMVRRIMSMGDEETMISAIHIEDQAHGCKKCGHMSGKVLDGTAQWLRTLNNARFALDTSGLDTLIVARTDAEAAEWITSHEDGRDQRFLFGVTIVSEKDILEKIIAKARKSGKGDADIDAIRVDWEKYSPMMMEKDGLLRNYHAVITDARMQQFKGGELQKVHNQWIAMAGLVTIDKAVENVIQQDSSLGITVEEWRNFVKSIPVAYDVNFIDVVKQKAKELGIHVYNKTEWNILNAKSPETLKEGKAILWDFDITRTEEKSRTMWMINTGMDMAIARSIAAMPYADISWMEQHHPHIGEVKQWSEAIDAAALKLLDKEFYSIILARLPNEKQQELKNQVIEILQAYLTTRVDDANSYLTARNNLTSLTLTENEAQNLIESVTRLKGNNTSPSFYWPEAKNEAGTGLMTDEEKSQFLVEQGKYSQFNFITYGGSVAVHALTQEFLEGRGDEGGYLEDGMLALSRLQQRARTRSNAFVANPQTFAGNNAQAFMQAAADGQATAIPHAGGKGDTMALSKATSLEGGVIRDDAISHTDARIAYMQSQLQNDQLNVESLEEFIVELHISLNSVRTRINDAYNRRDMFKGDGAKLERINQELKEFKQQAVSLEGLLGVAIDRVIPLEGSENILVTLEDVSLANMDFRLSNPAKAYSQPEQGIIRDLFILQAGQRQVENAIEDTGDTAGRSNLETKKAHIEKLITKGNEALRSILGDLAMLAKVEPKLQSDFPRLFETKEINGRQLKPLEVITALTEAAGPNIPKALNARRELLESTIPTKEKYAFPDMSQEFTDGQGNVWTFGQIVQGMMDNFNGFNTPLRWRMNDEVPVPEDIFPLSRPGLQITGPSEPKNMAINQLNALLSVRMPDLEDAAAAWFIPVGAPQEQTVGAFAGIQNEAELLGKLWEGKAFKKGGKEYQLIQAINDRPTTIQRVPSIHLLDKHITINGKPVPAIAIAYALHFLNTHGVLKRDGSGNYYYQPKIQTPEEALTVEKMLMKLEELTGVPLGTIKIEALYEEGNAGRQLPAIMWVWRHRLIGTNVGRWDYIGSLIEMWKDEAVFPDPQGVNMNSPALIAYQRYNALLNLMGGMKNGEQTNAAPIGGMAAVMLYPPTDPYGRNKNNPKALRSMKIDKLRERLLGLIFVPEVALTEGQQVTLEDILDGKAKGRLYDTYRQSWVATTDKDYVAAGNAPLRADIKELQALLDAPEAWETDADGKNFAPKVESGLIKGERDLFTTLTLLNQDGKIMPWVIAKDKLNKPEDLFNDNLWNDLYSVPKGDITIEHIQHALYMEAQYGFQILNANYAAAIDDYELGLRFMNDLATYRIFNGWTWTAFHHQATVTKDGWIKGPELVEGKGVIPNKNIIEIKAGTKLTPEIFQQVWEAHNQWTEAFFAEQDRRGAVSAFDKKWAPVIMNVLKRQHLSNQYLQHSPRVLFVIAEASDELREQILHAIFDQSRDQTVAKVREGTLSKGALEVRDYVTDYFESPVRPEERANEFGVDFRPADQASTQDDSAMLGRAMDIINEIESVYIGDDPDIKAAMAPRLHKKEDQIIEQIGFLFTYFENVGSVIQIIKREILKLQQQKSVTVRDIDRLREPDGPLTSLMTLWIGLDNLPSPEVERYAAIIKNGRAIAKLANQLDDILLKQTIEDEDKPKQKHDAALLGKLKSSLVSAGFTENELGFQRKNSDGTALAFVHLSDSGMKEVGIQPLVGGEGGGPGTVLAEKPLGVAFTNELTVVLSDADFANGTSGGKRITQKFIGEIGRIPYNIISQTQASKTEGLKNSLVLVDSALLTIAEKGPVGGIDLTANRLKLQIKRDGNGVPLPLNMQQLDKINIEGFIPVIINITPVPNLPLLLGIKGDSLPTQKTSKSETADDDALAPSAYLKESDAPEVVLAGR